MVNAKRVEQKLPSLFVDGPTTKKKNKNSLIRYRYRLKQFKKKKPGLYNTLMNEHVAVLEKIETAVNSLWCKK